MVETTDGMNTNHFPSCNGPVVPSFEPKTVQLRRGSPVPGSDVFPLPVASEKLESGNFGFQDTPVSLFEDLKMQTSESCYKNFVIFDSTQNKNTVVLHPSWLSHGATPESQTFESAKSFVNDLQAFSSKVLKAMHNFHSSASELPGNELTKQKTAMDGGLTQYDHIQTVKEMIGADFSFGSGEDVVHSSEFHEDTEEIDALLSSDDELSSTGQSPSDVSSSSTKPQGQSILQKRVNHNSSPKDEDDDADSGPFKGDSKAIPSHSYIHSTMEGHYKRTLSGLKNTSPQYSATESPADNSQEVGVGHSAMNSRVCWDKLDSATRVKIRTSMKQLKNTVPGAEDLDTTGVLSKTIQYVKCLQNRLLDLEGKTEARAMKRIKIDASLPNHCG